MPIFPKHGKEKETVLGKSSSESQYILMKLLIGPWATCA